jgi:hypothetical protein
MQSLSVMQRRLLITDLLWLGAETWLDALGRLQPDILVLTETAPAWLSQHYPCESIFDDFGGGCWRTAWTHLMEAPLDAALVPIAEPTAARLHSLGAFTAWREVIERPDLACHGLIVQGLPMVPTATAYRQDWFASLSRAVAAPLTPQLPLPKAAQLPWSELAPLIAPNSTIAFEAGQFSANILEVLRVCKRLRFLFDVLPTDILDLVGCDGLDADQAAISAARAAHDPDLLSWLHLNDGVTFQSYGESADPLRVLAIPHLVVLVEAAAISPDGTVILRQGASGLLAEWARLAPLCHQGQLIVLWDGHCFPQHPSATLISADLPKLVLTSKGLADLRNAPLKERLRRLAAVL